MADAEEGSKFGQNGDANPKAQGNTRADCHVIPLSIFGHRGRGGPRTFPRRITLGAPEALGQQLGRWVLDNVDHDDPHVALGPPLAIVCALSCALAAAHVRL